MIELYKIKNDFAPTMMESMLNRRNITYNFRDVQEFQSERKRTVFNGLETRSYRVPQLWTLLSEENVNIILIIFSDVSVSFCT